MADTNAAIARMTRMAERLREHAAAVNDDECRESWTQEADDIQWLITQATATPPADAALADEAIIDLVRDYGCSRGRADSSTYRYEAKQYEQEAAETLAEIAAALRARAVPDGFVMVPVEPTEEMLFRGGSTAVQTGGTWYCVAREVYRAMLVASKGGAT